MELKSDGSPSNPVTPVKIPDCPVPASLLDELLKPSTSVNKEPLNNLHNCLRHLKEEMDILQKQMEEHTVTVHESMSSWTHAEEAQLELENNVSKSPTPLNNMLVTIAMKRSRSSDDRRAFLRPLEEAWSLSTKALLKILFS
ncbi:hypothetical protein KUCAC02_028261 [Chaenocephalus aceratus]|uniref:Uncharacterized protein n=1 Tax=Chaenocephalus aceratus TaxID=36190 RepID=A0ACB9X2X0_CHAAC|nr:hypothetical protein KUCAC02_028261 [Chaenocephalus aceratus]